MWTITTVVPVVIVINYQQVQNEAMNRIIRNFHFTVEDGNCLLDQGLDLLKSIYSKSHILFYYTHYIKNHLLIYYYKVKFACFF